MAPHRTFFQASPALCTNCLVGSKIELLTWSGRLVPGGAPLFSQPALGHTVAPGSHQGQPGMKKIWEAALRQASGDFLSTCEERNNRKPAARPGAGRRLIEKGEVHPPSPLSPFSGVDGRPHKGWGRAGSIC